jgi:hypothetical protein
VIMLCCSLTEALEYVYYDTCFGCCSKVDKKVSGAIAAEMDGFEEAFNAAVSSNSIKRCAKSISSDELAGYVGRAFRFSTDEGHRAHNPTRATLVELQLLQHSQQRVSRLCVCPALLKPCRRHRV